MFLLDTNILSHAQKPRPHPRLREWFSRQKIIVIPFPVLLEIEQGIADIRQTKPPKAAELTEWIDDLLGRVGVHHPEINNGVARTLAAMHSCRPLKNFWFPTMPSKKERRLGQDLFIAAVAIEHDMPIATLDGGDFAYIDRHFPLPGVYNPAFDIWVVRPRSAEDGLVKRSIAV